MKNRNLMVAWIVCLAIVLAYHHQLFAQPTTNNGSSMTALERHIHSVCQRVQDDHKTTDKLTKEDLADLPVGIARQIGNTVYVVAIDSAYWDGKGWFFTAYASIRLPGSSRPIAFRASRVGFNKGGLTLTETRMALAAPQYIALSDQVALELPADGSNYLEFDCNGFKAVNMKGSFSFVGSSIVPDKARTDENRVKATLEVYTSDLSNIIAKTNITPFKIAGLPEVSFEVKNATVDYSDFKNPTGLNIPEDYTEAFADAPDLWRGFFLEELNISVNGFAEEPTIIQARNLLIDDMGVTGDIAASNIVSIEQGSADGWPLSIESFALQFRQNKVKGGSLGGKMIVPFLGEDPVDYTALIEQVDREITYKFLLKINSDKEYATPFSTFVKLKEGSTVRLEKINGKLSPSATLHGRLSVKNEKFNATGIEFQNLELISRHPYITKGEFSTVSEDSEVAGFPVRIEKASFKLAEGQVALEFGVGLNFMSDEDKGFGASTRVALFAKLEDGNDDGRQKWEFAGVKISDINLQAATTAMNLKGRLTLMDNDPTYGSGFRGSLSLTIRNVLENGIQVTGYFGSKDGFRYWHADAYIPTGNIPVAPQMYITGLIGGASYKMSRSNPFQPDFAQLNTTIEGTDAPKSTNERPAYDFVPDKTAGYSFMAGVTLIAGSEKAFNSDAILEVSLNSSGGFKYVQFKGSGYFFTSLESRGRTTPKAPVYADLSAMYDHTNGVFHANLKTYMNLEGKIRGTGPNNMIGDAVIHMDSKDWYIYIGRSRQMLSIDMAGLATAQGYFMAGTQIEDLPAPPNEMSEIIKKRNPDLVRDESTLAMGRGFAVGVRFETGYDSKDKLTPFYASFKIGAGADMMIRDFGSSQCAGRTGRIGFDGWYASGQAYVYMKGKVGIKAAGTRFDFLNLGAAALLQAKLPNPTWLKGQLAGKYSVLGGLVEGKFNLKIIVGEECEVVQPGNELGDILVIADLKPDAGSSEVSVFSAPQVSFNTSIDTEFRMLSTSDEVNSYRVKLDEFTISQNGQNIPASFEWNSKKDVLALRTQETLPPQTDVRAFVKVHWEKSENGNWVPLLTNNQVSYEIREVTFRTGTAPDFIPDENIAYSYPINRQYNLLPKETSDGYVKLRRGQSYLFESSPNEKWTTLLRLTDIGGNVLESPATYDPGESTLHFPLPEGMKNQTVYTLSVLRRPEGSAVDSNVKRTIVARESGESEVNIASTSITAVRSQKIEKEIYTSAFRTSKFNTFQDKWNSLSGENDLFDIAVGNIAVIGKSSNIGETFDQFELNGYTDRNGPLIQVAASPDTEWLRRDIGPLMYDLYPADPNVTITYRDTNILGVRPLKAVRLEVQSDPYALTDDNIESGVAGDRPGSIKVMYYLSYTGFRDFSELRNKAARVMISSGNLSPGIQRLLSAQGYIDLVKGSYPVDVRYVLPGSNQVTTQKQMKIEF